LAQTSQLNQLAERRRVLVARSNELRQECGSDFAKLRSTGTWFERGILALRSGRAVWPMVTGLAGLVGGGTRHGWISKAVRVVSWIGLGKKSSWTFPLEKAWEG